MPPPAHLGFAQPHDEVGVGSPGPAGVDARVEVRGRLQISVAQQLPDQFIRAWVGVENDLGCQVAKLMRGDFDSEMPQNGLLDGDLDRSLRSRLARKGDEHRIGTRAVTRGAISLR
jgi:hypothetical protein